ncbi:hypothetical protein B0I37DRAFT_381803 [Chaetomium sp. MPI-CAGE-AT-0009]|nr:hypothetical protein B0I37DRAFT_381803 [Chaetomium sp. MPI-CAGE-AT-0009]
MRSRWRAKEAPSSTGKELMAMLALAGWIPNICRLVVMRTEPQNCEIRAESSALSNIKSHVESKSMIHSASIYQTACCGRIERTCSLKPVEKNDPVLRGRDLGVRPQAEQANSLGKALFQAHQGLGVDPENGAVVAPMLVYVRQRDLSLSNSPDPVEGRGQECVLAQPRGNV